MKIADFLCRCFNLGTTVIAINMIVGYIVYGLIWLTMNHPMIWLIFISFLLFSTVIGLISHACYKFIWWAWNRKKHNSG